MSALEIIDSDEEEQSEEVEMKREESVSDFSELIKQAEEGKQGIGFC